MKIKIVRLKKSFFIFVCTLFIVLLICSCKKHPIDTPISCAYYEEASPRHLIAPDSVKRDSIITIVVDYNNQKHCQQFNSFSSSFVDSTVTISIQTKVDTCDCKDQFDDQFQIFKYQAPHFPGHSIIKIHVVDSLFYSHSIVVY